MSLVMDTIVLAKYWGFLHARGVAPSTIKKEMSNLNQSIDLITSKHISNTTKFASRYIKQVQEWLSNVVHHLDGLAKGSTSTMTPSNGTSIYELWECIDKEISAWERDFKVSACMHVVGRAMWMKWGGREGRREGGDGGDGREG